MLSKSFLMCHIDYCISIWGGAAPALTKPLFTLQKQAIRLATQSTFNAHTDPLFHKLNTPKFPDLQKNVCTKLAFQVIDTTTPLSIQECFQLLDQSSSLCSRSTMTICSIKKSKTFFHRVFLSAKNSRFITSAGGGVGAQVIKRMF
jgi:hypothetical protein